MIGLPALAADLVSRGVQCHRGDRRPLRHSRPRRRPSTIPIVFHRRRRPGRARPRRQPQSAGRQHHGRNLAKRRARGEAARAAARASSAAAIVVAILVNPNNADCREPSQESCRRRRAPLAANRDPEGQQRTAGSSRPSQPSPKAGRRALRQRRYILSIAGASNSSRWRRATRSPRSIHSASTLPMRAV